MSIIQLKAYSSSLGGRPWAAALDEVSRRIAAALALWRSRAATRRDLLRVHHMDDRLLADIGLTRLDLKPPPRDFIWWG
jgi:uncharacterized protein YjiS (DUF1127 family)